ncbi:glycosyltransferase family 4 protein [Micromonospora halophytica]|uniref:Glycosyl transferases group 1 n=1 Tax=Micromonospora halophytica TaxID=47864 RepID=A0A1C5IRA3_9ACTN|nr:glycosyltransferase family 4 protein [Micromonospora halophytica]SCG60878.1 Glycosyl transferases group 1 [Micromonospora halophytica]
MAEVLILLEQPTPYRNPVLNHLHDGGLDVLVLYHDAALALHGWGPVRPAHPSGTVPEGTLAACAFVARQMLAEDLRVLCCFGYHRPANLLAVLLARLRGVRVVTRSDSNWLDERRRPRLRRLLKKAVLRLVFGSRTRVWTVGRQNDLYWSHFGFVDRHLIPLDVPTPPVGTGAEGAAFRRALGSGVGLVVLYVGRLVANKGLDTLIEAFRAFEDPSARLLVVGKGPLRPAVDEAARRDPRIVAVGPLTQDELGSAYAAADLFVLPSHYEPWGLVVAEAQANGLRVAVSDVVGCHCDRVGPENGWVFPVGDSRRLAEVFREAATLRDSAGGLRIPPTPSFHAGPAMLADLARLGATPRLREPARATGHGEHPMDATPVPAPVASEQLPAGRFDRGSRPA